MSSILRSRSLSPISSRKTDGKRSRSPSPFKREEKTLVTKHDHQVYVARSKIPKAGLGLYAKRYIKAGATIIEYKGVNLTPSQYETLYPHNEGQYILYKRIGSVYIDASCVSKSSMGRYANHANSKSRRKPNARYTEAGFIVAKDKPINEHDEILVDYGTEFHFVDDAADVKTSVTMSINTDSPVIPAASAAAAVAVAVPKPSQQTAEEKQNVAMWTAMNMFDRAVSCEDVARAEYAKAEQLRKDAKKILDDTAKAIRFEFIKGTSHARIGMHAASASASSS